LIVRILLSFTSLINTTIFTAKKNNLKVREEKNKGIWVEGMTEVYVSSEDEVLDVIRAGSQNRAIAETKMNFESSRSHSLFILSVSQKNLKDMSSKTGKLYLVDLAGSEKVEKTGAQGTTLDEAKMINKSLSSLGNVINALTDGKVFFDELCLSTELLTYTVTVNPCTLQRL
jgi:kinesin family member 5